MITAISSLTANAHVDDLHRVAAQRRAIPRTLPPTRSARAHAPAVMLRIAGADDAGVVDDLAALDSAAALDGQVLLALTDGAAVAALSLRDGRVVANPFVRTEAAVTLLRLRAEHLSGGRSRRRRPMMLRPRVA